MRLISVNTGHRQAIQRAKSSGITGIFKLPVDGPVQIGALGLEGDFIADIKNHGGPDQAVYLYGTDDYDWWSQALGEALAPGTFGENLTIEGLRSAEFRIGDRLVFDEVILEITSPRIPCSTLAARMGDAQFVKRFRKAERPGLYCRVIHEGAIRRGQKVLVEPYAGETVSILEMFRDWYEPDRSEAAIQRYLDAPIAIRAREEKEEQLAKLK